VHVLVNSKFREKGIIGLLEKITNTHPILLTNPHCARVVGYCPYVIHKEGLCPSSGDIDRLMIMKSHSFSEGVKEIFRYSTFFFNDLTM
jgi:hypothetical protein